MFKTEIKGLKSTCSSLNKLSNTIGQSARIGLENCLENAQKTALKNKKGKQKEEMIPVQIIFDDKKIIVGRIYTDKTVFSYASFLEYGTGIYAELQHIGTSKTFLKSGYRYWLLPVEKADRDFGNDRVIFINGNAFYLMFSAQPHPFMRPTAFEIRKENLEIMKKALQKGIREVVVK